MISDGPGTRGFALGVGLRTERLTVEEEFDAVAVAEDEDFFVVGLSVVGGPVGAVVDKGLRFAGDVAGGGTAFITGDDDHGFVGPPALALIGDGMRNIGQGEQAVFAGDFGPCAGLAEIIGPYPEEVSGIFGMVTHRGPGAEGGPEFGAHDFTGRFVGMGFEKFGIAVIGADDVEEISKAVGVIVADIRTEEGLRDGTRGIVFVEGLDEGFEDGDGDFRMRGVVNFVAGTVEDDGGVVAVAADGIAGVDEGPILEIEMVIIGVFGHGPAIEHFIHHKEAHAVAEIEEFRGLRIVGGADGVGAEGFERGKAMFVDGERHGDAEALHISVKSDAFDLDIFSVEPESGVGFELGVANAERSGVIIKNFSARADFADGTVHVGVIEVPELRGDGKVLIKRGNFTGGDGLGSGFDGADLFGGGVHEGDLDGDLARGVGLVDDGVLDVDGRLVGGDGGSGDIGAVGVDVDGIGDDNADMAIDARAGVPAGGGLHRIIGADGEDIVGAGSVEVAGEFIAEANVTIGAFAEVEAVDPDIGVGHDAVEVDEDAAVGVGGRKGEMLAIPADARGEECARAAGGGIGVEGAFDGPVMRDGDIFPGGIVESDLFPVGAVRLQKLPVGIEGLGDAGRGCGLATGGGGGEAEKGENGFGLAHERFLV